MGRRNIFPEFLHHEDDSIRKIYLSELKKIKKTRHELMNNNNNNTEKHEHIENILTQLK